MDIIFRESVKKLTNLVLECLFECTDGSLYAFLIRLGLVYFVESFHPLEALFCDEWVSLILFY